MRESDDLFSHPPTPPFSLRNSVKTEILPILRCLQSKQGIMADVLYHACFANLGMRTLQRFRPALDLKGPAYLKIGNAHELPSRVANTLLITERKKLKWIISKCHKHFDVIFDGSPLGENAEAVMIRLARRSDGQILDLLVSVRLFKCSLTGENIASHGKFQICPL